MSPKMSSGSTKPLDCLVGIRFAKIATNSIPMPGTPVLANPTSIAAITARIHMCESKIMGKTPR